jgi:hypothetical protein
VGTQLSKEVKVCAVLKRLSDTDICFAGLHSAFSSVCIVDKLCSARIIISHLWGRDVRQCHIFVLQFCNHKCSVRPLRTVLPIYGTGVPLPSRCCILYIFSTNISTEYFKHAAHSPFFSSKCRLFHNATFFCSFIIHILHTGCAKISM